MSSVNPKTAIFKHWNGKTKKPTVWAQSVENLHNLILGFEVLYRFYSKTEQKPEDFSSFWILSWNPNHYLKKWAPLQFQQKRKICKLVVLFFIFFLEFRTNDVNLMSIFQRRNALWMVSNVPFWNPKRMIMQEKAGFIQSFFLLSNKLVYKKELRRNYLKKKANHEKQINDNKKLIKIIKIMKKLITKNNTLSSFFGCFQIKQKLLNLRKGWWKEKNRKKILKKLIIMKLLLLMILLKSLKKLMFLTRNTWDTFESNKEFRNSSFVKQTDWRK